MLTEVMRTMSSSLQEPVVVILVALVVIVVVIFGMLVAELFTERRHFRVWLPRLVDELQHEPDTESVIRNSGLLARQKRALIEILHHPDATESERESMTVNLVFLEQSHFDNRVRVTNLIAKISPMLGLMGTLIPLGPGIVAIGDGNTELLSQSLLIAFDTTVLGLVVAAVAIVISTIRKAWYQKYMNAFESAAECVLEKANEHGKMHSDAIDDNDGFDDYGNLDGFGNGSFESRDGGFADPRVSARKSAFAAAPAHSGNDATQPFDAVEPSVNSTDANTTQVLNRALQSEGVQAGAASQGQVAFEDEPVSAGYEFETGVEASALHESSLDAEYESQFAPDFPSNVEPVAQQSLQEPMPMTEIPAGYVIRDNSRGYRDAGADNRSISNEASQAVQASFEEGRAVASSASNEKSSLIDHPVEVHFGDQILDEASQEAPVEPEPAAQSEVDELDDPSQPAWFTQAKKAAREARANREQQQPEAARGFYAQYGVSKKHTEASDDEQVKSNSAGEDVAQEPSVSEEAVDGKAEAVKASAAEQAASAGSGSSSVVDASENNTADSDDATDSNDVVGSDDADAEANADASAKGSELND